MNPGETHVGRTVQRVAGTAPGLALGLASGITGAIRRGKPLHPIGHVADGEIVVTDPIDLGVPLLAEVRGAPVRARWSRAIGLPRSWPDLEGMAVRFPGAGDAGDDADLLFASTGSGPWSRFALTARPPGRFGPLTTLLPVRAAGRPVVFRLSPDGRGSDDLPPQRYRLDLAIGRRTWRRVGHLALAWRPEDSVDRFDPVTGVLRGLEHYPVVRTLREPAYAAARLTRAD